jgi:hypothetical protein
MEVTAGEKRASRRSGFIFKLAGMVLIAGQLSFAQQPAAPAPTLNAPSTGQTQKPTPQQSQGNPVQSAVGILTRRSIAFPDLAADRGPLTPVQKFQLFINESISPSRIVGSLASAGIGQAKDTFPGYGQGGEGYAKRFGASMASSASSHFFGTFLFASLLHQDPRYFVLLHGSFKQRTKYSLTRVFITRSDRGGNVINWSGLAGSLVAEGIADTYLPSEERTAGKTFERYGLRVGLGAVTNLLKEYWPTIHKSLKLSSLGPTQPDPATVSPLPPSGPPHNP